MVDAPDSKSGGREAVRVRVPPPVLLTKSLQMLGFCFVGGIAYNVLNRLALRKAGEMASARLGRGVDPLAPPPNDKGTYRLVRTGRNVGMFQLGSPGQMRLSGRLRPRRFADLVAQIGLFRAGPVRGSLVILRDEEQRMGGVLRPSPGA